MHLIGKYNTGFWFLLCAIDTFSKYAWAVPLKDKKVFQLLTLFKIFLRSLGKQNKVWMDKSSEF